MALDRLAAVRRNLAFYERRIRGVLDGLEALGPVLRDIRDMNASAFDRTVEAEARLDRLLGEADGVAPPADAAPVHATLTSALRMAREACVRRQQADVARKMAVSREASAAAAGALLLAERVRMDLTGH